ncbi:MAG: hypothetical protein AAGA56_20730, partial [Myxococcota bacterium]
MSPTTPLLRFVIPCLASFSLVVACGDDPESNRADEDDDDRITEPSSSRDTDDPDGPTTGPGMPGPGQPSATAPQVVNFTSSAEELLIEPFGADEILLTAEVRDPNGSTDIAAGILTDEAGANYGTFLKSGGGDIYVIRIDWA